MTLSKTDSTPISKQENRFTTYPAALSAISIVFFMWGFLTCLNDILIPHLKTVFSLNYTKAMLIQFTFFGAYFLMSIPGGKLVSKLGYKKGIISGLLVAAIGAFGFWPAAMSSSYYLFLSTLFILATGITILQVGANPYVTLLGPQKTSSSRLNMTQALNALGTTVAPSLGGLLILAGVSYTLPDTVAKDPATTQLISTLNTRPASEIKPALDTAKPETIAYALNNIPPFIYQKIPATLLSDEIQRFSPELMAFTLNNIPLDHSLYILSHLSSNQLALLPAPALVDALDSFTTTKLTPSQARQLQQLNSNLPIMARNKIAQYRSDQAKSVQKPYAALGCILLLLAGFIALVRLPVQKEELDAKTGHYSLGDILQYPHVILGAIAIFCYVGAEVSVGSFMVNYLTLPEIGRMTARQASQYVAYFWGGAMIGRVIGSALMVKLSPRKMLATCAMINFILLVITMKSTGSVAVYSIISLGLFNSIMFPTIFSLGIAGLGPLTEQGSSLLIMAIVGGAIIPFIQGMIADSIGLHHAFLLPLLCYIYIIFYGIKGAIPRKTVT